MHYLLAFKTGPNSFDIVDTRTTPIVTTNQANHGGTFCSECREVVTFEGKPRTLAAKAWRRAYSSMCSTEFYYCSDCGFRSVVTLDRALEDGDVYEARD